MKAAKPLKTGNLSRISIHFFPSIIKEKQMCFCFGLSCKGRSLWQFYCRLIDPLWQNEANTRQDNLKTCCRLWINFSPYVWHGNSYPLCTLGKTSCARSSKWEKNISQVALLVVENSAIICKKLMFFPTQLPLFQRLHFPIIVWAEVLGGHVFFCEFIYFLANYPLAMPLQRKSP